MDDLPTTRYVKSDDVHIAYQVFGQGSLDLLFVTGFVSNIDAIAGGFAWLNTQLQAKGLYKFQPSTAGRVKLQLTMPGWERYDFEALDYRQSHSIHRNEVRQIRHWTASWKIASSLL